MPSVSEPEIRTRPAGTKTSTSAACYHCGQPCLAGPVHASGKDFCCDGCSLVYEILNEKDLCNYYNLSEHPGLAQVKPIRKDKYQFLDDPEIASRLCQFTDGTLCITTLYIPSIHCSSCLWLLEHMGRLNPGILESRTNFSAKEVTIRFSQKKISLRAVVELLATIGYEPYISLEDTDEKKVKTASRQRTIKLGIAGFCFGNIMMMSFPEYLSSHTGIEAQYTYLFRYLNLILALPVFFYSASEFFATAWAGLKQRILNIDAPIVLALIITFGRSLYEILSGTGAGYLDSMSGIVFFMLAGRLLQERTYKSLSFTRDYKSYFPIAVNVQTANGLVSTQLSRLRQNDVVVLRYDEIIPADGTAINGNALLDYSFVTGESQPVKVKAGEKVFAGGRQVGEELVIRVDKPIASSYLTSLWNHQAFARDKTRSNDRTSAIHVLSKHFTAILFSLAALTAAYWYFADPTRIMSSVTAMLIVACPCALLLSATFTNSSILRILGINGLFLRDATVIEQLADTTHIVFDKTGTITHASAAASFSGHELTAHERDLVYSIVRQSNHPNSKALATHLVGCSIVPLLFWRETPGHGLQASAEGIDIAIGSAALAGLAPGHSQATFYIKMGENITGVHLHANTREGIPSLMSQLRPRYTLSLLSGDNNRQESYFRQLLGPQSTLLFGQKPLHKLAYIETLQRDGKKVMMVGDGLNDAGALQQSNVGITLADDVNNFTPACDAILRAADIGRLATLLDMARLGGRIIRLSFAISILYNVIGLCFAVTGHLRPVTAAILMPASTLSIVIVSAGLSNLAAWKKGLNIRA